MQMRYADTCRNDTVKMSSCLKLAAAVLQGVKIAFRAGSHPLQVYIDVAADVTVQPLDVTRFTQCQQVICTRRFHS